MPHLMASSSQRPIQMKAIGDFFKIGFADCRLCLTEPARLGGVEIVSRTLRAFRVIDAVYIHKMLAVKAALGHDLPGPQKPALHG